MYMEIPQSLVSPHSYSVYNAKRAGLRVEFENMGDELLLRMKRSQDLLDNNKTAPRLIIIQVQTI